MLDNGVLSATARKAIAGMMELAPSITAFGNTNPTSYFRLVPHQEAPTNICWGVLLQVGSNHLLMLLVISTKQLVKRYLLH